MSDVRETIRRLIEDVYGQGNIDLVDELVHEDYVDHTAPPGVPPDRDGLKAFASMVHQAMSDTETSMDRVVIDGDDVAWRWTTKGTHTGELMGVPASGNRVEVSGNDLGVMRDGKLAELWSEVDMMSLMVQIGALEPPTR